MPVRRPLLAALACAALLLSAPALAAAASPASYVRGAQNADGGFGSTQSAATSNQLVTGWATLGLAAAGRSPLSRGPGGRSAIAYIRRGLGGIRAIGDVERTVLVVSAAGLNPRRFGGRNLVRDILRHRQRNQSIAGFVSYTSFGILALRAAGVSRSSATIRRPLRWLRRQQNRDGGFNVRGRGGASGVDDTGYALQAMVAAGARSGDTARRAAGFLARRQNRDGGWGFTSGAASNAQSTSYAVQGLVAARRGGSRVRRGNRYLRSLTEGNGLVRYSRTSRQTPVWVSAQALLALNRKPFPLRRVR
jgi:hypothetical protein